MSQRPHGPQSPRAAAGRAAGPDREFRTAPMPNANDAAGSLTSLSHPGGFPAGRQGIRRPKSFVSSARVGTDESSVSPLRGLFLVENASRRVRTAGENPGSGKVHDEVDTSAPLAFAVDSLDRANIHVTPIAGALSLPARDP